MIGLNLNKQTFVSSLPKDHDCEGVAEKIGEIYL